MYGFSKKMSESGLWARRGMKPRRMSYDDNYLPMRAAFVTWAPPSPSPINDPHSSLKSSCGTRSRVQSIFRSHSRAESSPVTMWGAFRRQAQAFDNFRVLSLQPGLHPKPMHGPPQVQKPWPNGKARSRATLTLDGRPAPGKRVMFLFRIYLSNLRLCGMGSLDLW
jgi:hypothetical protein